MPPITLFMFDVKTTIIAALLVAIIVLSTCNSCKQRTIDKLRAESEQPILVPQNTVVRDTIPVHDTVARYVPKPIAYIPNNYIDANSIDPIVILRIDTFYSPVDTANILKDYFATRYYSDPIKTDYGTITINDSISQNRIKSRSAQLDLKIPETTIIRTQKKKAALYFALDGYGNKNEIINGAGVGLMYQSPRTLNYEVGTYFTSQQNINFRASIKFPLTKK